MQDRTIEVEVEGRGAHVVLMVHGWPDTLRLWDAQVAALKDRYVCARLTLPGFGPLQPTGPHTMGEVVDAIGQVADRISPNRPVTLLLHDWGCFFGYQYAMKHRDRVARVIGVDVGDAGSRYHREELGLKAKAITIGYQLWLALAWRIGGAAGNRMARWMARRFRAPANATDITASQGYPYAVQWFGVAGGFGRVRSFSPTEPMLFIYGERKPMMFHSHAWTERVRARPGCRVVSMPTGHWVMKHKPAEFNALVSGWLRETDAPGLR